MNFSFKIRNIIAFAVLSLFFGVPIKAQTTGIESGLGTLGNITRGGNPMRINLGANNSELVGSEYLFPEWKMAKVYLTEDTFVKINTKINTFSQEVEILDKNETKALLPDKIDKVEVNNRIFRYKTIDKSNSLVEVLVDGKIGLVKKFSAKIKKAVFKPGIQTEKPKDKIVIEETLYVKTPTSNFTPLRLSKKSIQKLINKDPSTLNFIKENSLSYKDESDVIKIINFYTKTNAN